MVLFIIFLLIGGVISFGLNALLLAVGFDLSSYCILAIFPLLGCFAGIIIALFGSMGVKKGNLQHSAALTAIATLFGCAMIFAMTYYNYYSFYIDSNNSYYIREEDFNHKFKGDHISEYELGDEKIDFGNFMKLNYFEATLTLSNNSGSSNGADINGVGKISYFLNYLEILLCVLGVFADINKERYCKNCKKYHKSKPLESYDVNSYQTPEEVRDKILGMAEDMRKIPYKNLNVPQFNHNVAISYCPNCMQGNLIVSNKVKSGNNYVMKPVQEFPLDASTATKVLNIAPEKGK